MEILQRLSNLVEKLESIPLRHACPWINEKEKSSVVGIFEEYVHHMFFLYRAFEADDVRVPQGLVNLDLFLQIREMDMAD